MAIKIDEERFEKENNMKEFPQENQQFEFEEETEMHEISEHKGLIAKFKALSFGKKVAVIVLLTGTVAGGIFVIYKLIKKDPKAVAEAIEAVSENPEVVTEVIDGVEVTTF